MAEKTITLSVALATYNEEKNITSCLDSVKGWVDEIILVDGGSSDETVKIAKHYTSAVTITDNPPIFHINKQKALDMCQSTWILQLDADEVVSPALKEEIRRIIKDPSAKNGYFIPRKNYFMGHWLKKGGQYPDYVMRLFRNGTGRFPSKSVHEQIEIQGETGYLKSPLDHYTIRTRADYWRKANTYIDLTVDEYRKKNLSKNILRCIEYVLARPVVLFLTLWIRHKGFLDGVYGLEFAFYSALHPSLSYLRYLGI